LLGTTNTQSANKSNSLRKCQKQPASDVAIAAKCDNSNGNNDFTTTTTTNEQDDPAVSYPHSMTVVNQPGLAIATAVRP